MLYSREWSIVHRLLELKSEEIHNIPVADRTPAQVATLEELSNLGAIIESTTKVSSKLKAQYERLLAEYNVIHDQYYKNTDVMDPSYFSNLQRQLSPTYSEVNLLSAELDGTTESAKIDVGSNLKSYVATTLMNDPELYPDGHVPSINVREKMVGANEYYRTQVNSYKGIQAYNKKVIALKIIIDKLTWKLSQLESTLKKEKFANDNIRD